MPAGLVVAALLVSLLDWVSVNLVGDISEISRSLPSLPLLSLVLVPQPLLLVAAIGIIDLVQGAGVSHPGWFRFEFTGRR